MKHLRWFVLPVLLMAADAALSAQILGSNPITGGAHRLAQFIMEAGWWLGIGAIVVGGLASMVGRFDGDWMMRLVFGGALVFGASAIANALFPGMAP